MTWIQVAMGALALGSFATAAALARVGMTVEAVGCAGLGTTILALLAPQLGAKKP